MLDLSGTHEEQEAAPVSAMLACATLLGVNKPFYRDYIKLNTQEEIDALASAWTQNFSLPILKLVMRYLKTDIGYKPETESREKTLRNLSVSTGAVQQQIADETQRVQSLKKLGNTLETHIQGKKNLIRQNLEKLARVSLGITFDSPNSTLENEIKNRGGSHRQTSHHQDVYTFKKNDPSVIRTSLLLMTAKGEVITMKGGTADARIQTLKEVLIIALREGHDIRLNDDSEHRLSGEEKQLWDIINLNNKLEPPYQGNLSYLYQKLPSYLAEKLIEVLSVPLANENNAQQNAFKEKLNRIHKFAKLREPNFLDDLLALTKHTFDLDFANTYKDPTNPVFVGIKKDFHRSTHIFISKTGEITHHFNGTIFNDNLLEGIIHPNFQPFFKAVTYQTLSPLRLPNLWRFINTLRCLNLHMDAKNKNNLPFLFQAHTTHITSQIDEKTLRITTKLTNSVTPFQTDQNLFDQPLETHYYFDVSLEDPTQPWGPENREIIKDVNAIILNGDQSLTKLHELLKKFKADLTLPCRGENDPDQLTSNTSIADLIKTEIRHIVEVDIIEEDKRDLEKIATPSKGLDPSASCSPSF